MHDGKIGEDAALHDIALSIELALLLALGDEGADAGLGEEGGMPAPPARMRSARVPCGLNSSASLPAR